MSNCCEHGYLMLVDENSKDFIYRSAGDGCTRKGTAEETLILETPLDVNIEDNVEFWKYVARDPTNEKIKKDCINCKNTIIAKVRVRDGVPVYACTCGTIWK